MVEQKMMAVVRFTREGWHFWREAPPTRNYLSTSHRHLFYVEIQLEVFHNEREVEYHDLLDFCKAAFPGGDMRNDSCETMAKALAQKITAQFSWRLLQVSIFEDNEVGAIYSFSP